MQLTAAKPDLLAALSTVGRALSAKTTLPILEGIYLSAQAGRLEMKCTDMALGIQTAIAADVREAGEVVLPGKLFIEVIRKLPDDGDICIKVDDRLQATITCQHARVKLQGLRSDDYPALPDTGSDGWQVRIGAKAFQDMVRTSVFAIAIDETRPILTGVLLECGEDQLTMVALDGYRMALRRSKAQITGNVQEAVVPGRSLSEIGKLIGDWNEEILMIYGKNHLCVDLGDTRVVTRLLDGEFIRYRQILPGAAHTHMRLSIPQLYGAVERAQILAREGRNNLVKFAIKEEMLVVTAQSELGEVYEEISAEVDGKPLEIAFNARYVYDILKCLNHDEPVSLDFTTNVSPCVVRPIEGDAFVYLVLPVRFS